MPQTSLDHLLTRFREEDDLLALGQLFDRTAPGLLGLGRRLLGGDRARAEDLVQETFLAVIEGASAWDSTRPVLPWLVGILGNQLRRERRREGRDLDPERLAEQLSSREVARPENLSADREARSEVEQAIDALPKSLRDVVRGKLIEGRETETLAAELGLTGGALRVRLHRGLSRMRQLLPAGLATALGAIFVGPSRLGAMRAHVLDQAAPGAKSVAVGSISIAGVMLSKQVVAVAGVALLALTTIGVLLYFALSEGPMAGVDAAPTEIASTDVEIDDPVGTKASSNSREAIPELASSSPPIEASPTLPEENLGGSLSGIVVDEDGLPVPFAEVQGWNTRDYDRAPDITVVANSKGEFNFEQLGPGLVVMAHTDELVCDVGLHGALKQGQIAEGLELILSQSWILRGRVLTPTGQPVAEAPVQISDGRRTSSSWHTTSAQGVQRFQTGSGKVVTDSQGRFRVEKLPRGSASVRINQPPFNVYREWQEESLDEIEIRLDAGLCLKGRVVDSTGQPAVGARIRFWPFFGNVQNVPYWAETDSKGLFELVGMNRQSEWGDEPTGIAVLHEGHAIEVVDSITPDEGDGPVLQIRLIPEAKIIGRVINAAGRPLPDVRLWLEGDRIYEHSTSYGYPNTWESAVDLNERKTLADGSFSFAQLYPGTFSLRAFTPGSENLTIETSITLDRGQIVEDVVLKLDPQAMRKVVLKGIALDQSTGKAVRSFSLTPFRDGHGTTHKFDDPSGAFEFPGLEPGEMSLTFSAPGFASRRIPASSYNVGEYEFTIEFFPTRSLSVRAVNSKGKPQSNATVSVRDMDGSLVMMPWGSGSTHSQISAVNDGTMELHGLPACPLTLFFESGYARREIELDLTLPYEGVFEVAIDHITDVNLSVQFLAADDSMDEEEVARHWSRMNTHEESSAWISEALAEGRLTFPTGTISLRAEARGQAAYSGAKATYLSLGRYLCESWTDPEDDWFRISNEMDLPILDITAPPGPVQLHITCTDYNDRVISTEAVTGTREYSFGSVYLLRK